MVAINFKNTWAEKVSRGEKRNTIRRIRKNPICVGDELQLYTGLRTKDSKLIGEVVCQETTSIHIGIKSVILFYHERIDGKDVLVPKLHEGDAMDEFAKKDGFANADEFFAFFRENYPEEDLRNNMMFIAW